MPSLQRNDFPDFGRDAQAIRTMFKRLPTIAGNMAINFFKDSFRREGFIDSRYNRWKPRKVQGDGSRRGRRGTLTKTGELQRSITYRPGPAEFRVFSDKAYAQIHNEGGRIRITRKMRAYFFFMYNKTKKEHWRNLATTKKQFFEIPQRQFMGESNVLDKRIAAHVTAALDKAFMS